MIWLRLQWLEGFCVQKQWFLCAKKIVIPLNFASKYNLNTFYEIRPACVVLWTIQCLSFRATTSDSDMHNLIALK